MRLLFAFALLAACTRSAPPSSEPDADPPPPAIDAPPSPPTCPSSGGACSKQDGLVASWSLDEVSDGTAPVVRRDATACGHDLADPYAVASTTDAQRGAGAAVFDWSAGDPLGKLVLEDRPSLALFHDGSFTIALWFQLRGTDLEAAGKLLVKGYPESQGAHELGFEYQRGGACDEGPLPHLHVGVYGETGGTTTCVPRASFDPDEHVGEWHFMTMWHDVDAQVLSVSIDDGPVFSKSTAGLVVADTTAPLDLGGFQNATQSALDDVMIWNRALTAAERTSVFTNALECP
jgi:hypothetical protein